MLGLAENLAHSQKQTHQETTLIVQKVSQKRNVRVEKDDISIAHRLSSNNGTPKPVIAKFTRRVTETELIYKDATKPLVNSMSWLRNDERINKA